MPFDLNNYHKKWSLIRRLILKRAGEVRNAQNEIVVEACCEWCGAENHRPHPDTKTKVELTTAHIDRDRTHNWFSNLAALCQKCHLNYDRPIHIFNRKYGRETKYVCGKLFD
jgi:5-methylcytosine-specific restriction endonuclease McrA